MKSNCPRCNAEVNVRADGSMNCKKCTLSIEPQIVPPKRRKRK